MPATPAAAPEVDETSGLFTIILAVVFGACCPPSTAVSFLANAVAGEGLVGDVRIADHRLVPSGRNIRRDLVIHLELDPSAQAALETVLDRSKLVLAYQPVRIVWADGSTNDVVDLG